MDKMLKSCKFCEHDDLDAPLSTPCLPCLEEKHHSGERVEGIRHDGYGYPWSVHCTCCTETGGPDEAVLLEWNEHDTKH
jgi:hypothetical protein